MDELGINTKNIHIAYCPERVLPGRIMIELVENDRIVGGLNTKATKIVSDFYRTFVKGEVIETNAKTAEMCKLAENSFRDVNIAFANELSIICKKEGINPWEMIRLANKHPRVNILQPGTGVGGHCIAVDPWFIVATNEKNSKLIRTAREVNLLKTKWVTEQIKNAAIEFYAKVGRKPKIACLGLAFKPNIDDLRESTALMVAKSLLKAGYDILAVEPNIKSHDLFVITDLDQAIDQADLIAFLVMHDEFINFNFDRNNNNKKLLDFCGIANEQYFR